MSCGCANCNDNLIIDPLVLNEGADGENGVYGGFSSTWLFETNTGSTPSTKCVRFNNTTYSSVTQIYIHVNNSETIDHEDFLDEFATDGYISIYKEFNPNIFAKYKISSVTLTSGTKLTATVTYINGNGTFGNTNKLVLSYTPNSVSSSLSNISVVDDGDSTTRSATLVSGDQILESLTYNNRLFYNDGDRIRIVATGNCPTNNRTKAIKIGVSDGTTEIFINNSNVAYQGNFTLEGEFIAANILSGYWKTWANCFSSTGSNNISSNALQSTPTFDFTSTTWTITLYANLAGNTTYVDLYTLNAYLIKE